MAKRTTMARSESAVREEFNDLRSAYLRARDQLDDTKRELGARAGYQRGWEQWLRSTERKRLERLYAAKDRAADKFWKHLRSFAHRNWDTGVPSSWVLESLSFEDAWRPASEPLSVVPPLAYGATQPIRNPQRKESSMRRNNQKSFPGFGARMEIRIPKLPRYKQISGDMDPGAHGALLARSDGDAIELLEIQSVRDLVGDDEAAEVGFPFWSREAYYDLEDLDLDRQDVKQALKSVGLDEEQLEEMDPETRALAIAEGLYRYGFKAEESNGGWSADVLPEGIGEVEWWGDKVEGASYIADEDDLFRREILGEEDEDEEDEDEDDDYTPNMGTGSYRNSTLEMLDVLEHLKKGDRVKVASHALKRPRVLTITQVDLERDRIVAYTSSGRTRPGHQAGGQIIYSRSSYGDRVMYQPTMLQQIIELGSLEKVSVMTSNIRRNSGHWTDPPGRGSHYATRDYIISYPDGSEVNAGHARSDQQFYEEYAQREANRTGKKVTLFRDGEAGIIGKFFPEKRPAKNGRRGHRGLRRNDSYSPMDGGGRFQTQLDQAVFELAQVLSNEKAGSINGPEKTEAVLLRDGDAIAQGIRDLPIEVASFWGGAQEFLRTKASAGVIVFTDSNDYVQVVYYDSQSDLDADWAEAQSRLGGLTPNAKAERRTKVKQIQDTRGARWVNGRSMHDDSHVVHTNYGDTILIVEATQGINAVPVKYVHSTGVWELQGRMQPFDNEAAALFELGGKKLRPNSSKFEIIEGAARGFFVDAWASGAEEAGHSFAGGTQLEDVAPETPDDITVFANKFIRAVEILNGNTAIVKLYAAHRDAKGQHAREPTPEDFGFSLAMQSLGHGVSWYDDHPVPSRGQIKLPRTEVLVDVDADDTDKFEIGYVSSLNGIDFRQKPAG